MRPIKLTMQAFGSYRDRTILDFTKADQNLFLITRRHRCRENHDF